MVNPNSSQNLLTVTVVTLTFSYWTDYIVLRTILNCVLGLNGIQSFLQSCTNKPVLHVISLVTNSLKFGKKNIITL